MGTPTFPLFALLLLVGLLLVDAQARSAASSSSTYSHASSSSHQHGNAAGAKYDSHASASRSENGVTYDYTYDNGKETLRVKGNPPNFDREELLRYFRKSVGLDPDRFGDQNQDVNILLDSTAGSSPQQEASYSYAYAHAGGSEPDHTYEKPENPKEGNPINLLSSVSNFLMSTSLGSNFQQLYESITREETNEQLRQAKEDLNNVEDDLSKIVTQQHILRARQAELGSYLQDVQGKSCLDRNPTIEELVHTEDDRLALLEHRLDRMQKKLLRQKNELLNYIQMHERNFQGREETPYPEREFTEDCQRKT